MASTAPPKAVKTTTRKGDCFQNLPPWDAFIAVVGTPCTESLR